MKSGHLPRAAVVSRSLDPYGLPWRKNAVVAFERAAVAFERERSHEHAGAPRRASSCGASVVRLSFSYRIRDGIAEIRKMTDVDGQRRPPYALPRHSIATIDLAPSGRTSDAPMRLSDERPKSSDLHMAFRDVL